MKPAERGDLWSYLVAQGQKATAAAAGGSAPKPAPDAGTQDDGSAVTTTVMTAPRGRDSYVIFLGDKSAGKSTLRSHFLNPTKELDARPKPTVGLDYQFGRRTNPDTNGKDVAHMWELAGGTAAARAAELTAVPLSHPGRRSAAVVVLVLDLSRPGDLLPSMRKWCGAAANALERASSLSGASSSSTSSGQRGGSRSSSPVPGEEEEKDASRGRGGSGAAGAAFPVPLLMLGAKADMLAREDAPKRKLVQQALRFGASAYGATLVCTATDKAGKDSLKAFRLALSAAVFGTAASRRATGVDEKTAAKPLYVPAASEHTAPEKIGFPRGIRASEFELMGRDAQLDTWQRAVCEFYAPTRGRAR